MSENMVHNLYKFIKEGVTPEQMFAASAAAFCEKVVTEEAMLAECIEMESNQTYMLNHLNEVAPEGWEGTVKGMKANKKISNPWALAWWMKDKGYKPQASEGKLPADLANIQDPAKDVQSLKEENKEGKDSAENPAIKTDNAGVTPEPEETKVSAELDKQTPGVDKLVQDKDGKDPLVEPDKVKEEKKEEVKVTDVEKVKAENEGKLPADLANIQKPDQYAQDLTEDAERVIADGISEENVAKDLASRHKGEAVQNPDTKLWKVVTAVTNAAPATVSATTVPAVEAKVEEKVPCVKAEEPKEKEAVKEEKIEECPTVKGVNKDEKVPDVKAAKGTDADKLVKEDVDVTIKTDDKEVNIVAANGSTQVTTLDVGTPAPLVGLETPPLTAEVPISEPEPELSLEEEPEFTDDEALEMAEKLMVAEHLSKMDEKAMSAKQKKFLEDMKAKKFSKKNQDKIEKKKKEIK